MHGFVVHEAGSVRLSGIAVVGVELRFPASLRQGDCGRDGREAADQHDYVTACRQQVGHIGVERSYGRTPSQRAREKGTLAQQRRPRPDIRTVYLDGLWALETLVGSC